MFRPFWGPDSRILFTTFWGEIPNRRVKVAINCLDIQQFQPLKNNEFNFFHMGVSKNSGTPKSSILIGFSIINHPFWGTPIFGNIHILDL